MNTNITIRRILALFLSLCLMLSGTALAADKGKKNFNEGKKYEATQQWDLAAQSYALAVSADPNNPEYRLRYLRALQQASLMYVKRGDALSEQNDYAGAYTAYRAAYQYDQGNEVARIKMERMLDQQKAAAGGLEPVNTTSSGNVRPTSFIEIKNPPRNREALQDIQFNAGSGGSGSKFKMVAKTLGKLLDLNVIFDKDVKDDPIDIELKDTTVAKAFDHVLLMTKHTFEQLDRRTILIYQDNATNKPRFEKLYVKTFYLGNITAQQARSAVNVILGPSRTAQELQGAAGGGGGGSASSNVLLVKATPQELQLVQDMLKMLDKNKNEVVLDVEIYEVSHDSMLQIGNQIATNPADFLAERKDDKGVITREAVRSSGLSDLGGFGYRGALNRSVVETGLRLFSMRSGALIGLPPTTLSLLQSKGNSRLLHKTQIHVLDGQQNVTKVGRSVPVRLGQTYGGGGYGGFGGVGGQQGGIGGIGGIGGQQAGINGIGGFGGGFPIDSIQYKDVGLVIDAKPTITNEGYVEIQMKFETSDVLSSGSDVNLTPTFTQRSLNTTARIKDGVTAVVAGVNQESKGDSRAGIPVLSMVPILGRLFSTPRQEARQSDIVITVTPHIVRSAGISAEDYLAIQAGSGTPGQGGGLSPKIEEVVYRAQMEEEQERRLIALEQAPQQQNIQLTPNNQYAGAQPSPAPGANSQPQIQNTSNTNSGAAAANPRTPPRKLDNSSLVPVNSSNPQPPNTQFQELPPQPEPNSGAGGGEATGDKEKELKDGTVVGPEIPVPQAVVRMGVESEETRRRRAIMLKEHEAQKKREEEEAKAAKTKPQAAPQLADFAGATPSGGKVDRALPTALNSSRKVSFTLSPAPIRQQIGKSFNLTVEANGQGEMVGANLAIRFDDKKLKVKSVRGGDLFGQQPSLSHNVEKGVLKVQINTAKKTPVSAKGNVIVIEFEAIAEGESQVAFNNSDTKVNLADKKNAPASGSTAQVVITRDAVATSNQ